jgi:hypothetical protein
MKKIILLVFFTLGVSYAFDIRGLLVTPIGSAKGVMELNYSWHRNSTYRSESDTIKVIYTPGNPMSLTIKNYRGVLGTIYYDEKGKVLKQEMNGEVFEIRNVENYEAAPIYNVVERKNISLKGKSTLYVKSVRDHSQEDSKNHLVMKTTVNSTKEEYYDAETGILLRQEIRTIIKQETYTTFDRSRPLNVRQNNITEVLELEE